MSEVKPISDVYDDIPFTSDVGVDVISQLAMGIVATKDTPDDRIKIIHDAFKLALDDPKILNFFETKNMAVIYRDAQDFSDGMQQRSKASKKMLIDLGLIKP